MIWVVRSQVKTQVKTTCDQTDLGRTEVKIVNEREFKSFVWL